MDSSTGRSCDHLGPLDTTGRAVRLVCRCQRASTDLERLKDLSLVQKWTRAASPIDWAVVKVKPYQVSRSRPKLRDLPRRVDPHATRGLPTVESNTESENAVSLCKQDERIHVRSRNTA